MVCIGEGEEALLELVQKLEEGKHYFDTRNIWFKKDGKIIKNQLRPLIQDLDSLPYFDFSLDDHYIYDHTINSIAPMTKDLLKKCFPLEPNVEGSFSDSYKRTVSYKTMTTRGCPHHCTFCAERALADKILDDRGRPLSSQRELSVYLLEDLRIDPSHLAALDGDLVENLGRAAKSRKIIRCAALLRRLEKQP